ncbi:Plastidic glucose transporter 4, partial [Prunus dulcis]
RPSFLPHSSFLTPEPPHQPNLTRTTSHSRIDNLVESFVREDPLDDRNLEKAGCKLSMRGRQREAYSMYKRLSSRDYTNTIDMEAKELIDAIDVEENSALLQKSTVPEPSNPSWRLSFPHVVVATLSSFLFGYHLGVVNEPLESISKDLGFKGNTLAEGCMKLIFCFILSSIVISDFCIQLYL